MNVMTIITNREVEFNDILKKGEINIVSIHHQINSHYLFKVHSYNVQIRCHFLSQYKLFAVAPRSQWIAIKAIGFKYKSALSRCNVYWKSNNREGYSLLWFPFSFELCSFVIIIDYTEHFLSTRNNKIGKTYRGKILLTRRTMQMYTYIIMHNDTKRKRF